MTALTFMREFLHLGRGDGMAARQSSSSRRPRFVALESLQVSAPLSEEAERERIRRGHVAEMSARQAGL